MRITPHSTLAISTCALALLFQLPSVLSYEGGVFKEGDHPINTFAQEYVEANKEKLGLSNIRWGGGNKEDLRLARVVWSKQDAFMKCDIVSSKPEGFDVDIFEEAIAEVYAFRALVKANKELEGNYAIGRQNVMDPLHQFGFDKKDNGNKYFCHLYSYINGEPLEEYFRRHTISQAFIITSKILPDIIRGLIYLYNAGIIHYDLHPRNIMLQQDPTGRIVGVKIIGLDAADVFRKQFLWRPINPNNEEYSSANPRQNYESCHGLKDAMKAFLEPFVFYSIHQMHNPYTFNYGITREVALEYLKTFNQRPRYAKLELGDAKAVIPAVFRLTRAYYTIEYDRYTCSSPMRALRGLPPRTL